MACLNLIVNMLRRDPPELVRENVADYDNDYADRRADGESILRSFNVQEVFQIFALGHAVGEMTPIYKVNRMFPFDNITFHTLLNRLQGTPPLGLVRQTVNTAARGGLVFFSELYMDTHARRLDENPDDPGDLSFFEAPNVLTRHRGTTLIDYVGDYLPEFEAVPNHRNHFEIMVWDLAFSIASSTSLSVAAPLCYQVCISHKTPTITPFLPLSGIVYCAGIKNRPWGDYGLLIF